MRAERRARIGGIEFQGWPADHHGDWFVLDPDGIKSIWGGVDVRREDIARPATHGSYDIQGYLAPRVIPVSGHMSARNPQELEHMQARLSGLLADGSSARLTIDGPLGSRWCDVRLASSTQMTSLDATTARFMVTFWAADPRTYGDVRTFSAGQPSMQRGNFSARPVFNITGTAPGGYTITGTNGQVITVTYPVVPGWPHRIDTAKGGLFVNGNRVIGGISVWNPKPVGPGLPAVTFSITAGVSLQVDVTDTFI